MASTLATIDAAWDLAKVPCHRHDLDERARAHLEHAIAHLNAAWRAQDGQKVETPEAISATMSALLARPARPLLAPRMTP